MPLPEEGDMAHRLAEATGIYHVITEMMRLYRMSLETFQGLPTCFPLCHTEDGGKPTPPTPTRQVQEYLDFRGSWAARRLSPLPALCPLPCGLILGGLSEEPSLEVNTLNEL